MLTIKAGRAFRRESTSWVDPLPSKGLLTISPSDDGLVHFTWKNRETDTVEEELLLIPGDASFIKVAESSGRVFVLKFESSDQKNFYWVQDPSPTILERVEQNVNGLLQDPTFQPSWNTSSTAAPATTTTAPTATTRDHEMTSVEATQTRQPGIENDPIAQSIAAQVRALMGNMMIPPSGAAGAAQQTSVALSDVLSPTSLAPLFEPANSGVLASLQDFLPPDLPNDPSSTPEETLRKVIQSAPFQSSVRQLDRAFATGLLGQLMPGFGLPIEAGLSVDAFLKEIHDKAKRDQGGATE